MTAAKGIIHAEMRLSPKGAYVEIFSWDKRLCRWSSERRTKEVVPPSKLKKPINKATIALVTDGGLVPKGNPDRMVPVNSIKFAVYSISGKEKLYPADYEVKHQGYDNSFVLADPNRLVPVDAMRELERKGKIGKLYEYFFTTAGVMTTLENAKKFGRGIADKLLEANVDAVILTST